MGRGSTAKGKMELLTEIKSVRSGLLPVKRFSNLRAQPKRAVRYHQTFVDGSPKK
jgi:hypothetical protein